MAPTLVFISTSGLAANACADQSRMPDSKTLNSRMFSAHVELRLLRGRETVRADRRMRTDEKPSVRIRRSCIKSPPPSLFLSITVFSVRMLFIRTENTVGARERASPDDYAPP